MDSQGHYIDRTNEQEANDIRELQAEWRKRLREHHPLLRFNECAVNGIFAFSQLLAMASFDCCVMHEVPLETRDRGMAAVREMRFDRLADICSRDPEVQRWDQYMEGSLWDQSMEGSLVDHCQQLGHRVYTEACNRGRRDENGQAIARLERFAYHALQGFVAQAGPDEQHHDSD